VSPERFTVEGLRNAIGDSIDLLASPAGMVLKTLLPRDPTGEVLGHPGQLNPGAQPQMRGRASGPRAMASAPCCCCRRAPRVRHRRPGAGHRQSAGRLRAGAHVDRPHGCAWQMSGPGQFAVQTRETIKDEVKRLSLISSIAIWLVLLWVYRSFKLLAWA
jgi:predicted exporter